MQTSHSDPERERFNKRLVESLKLSGKPSSSMDSVVLGYAWRELGQGRSEDFLRSAFHFIAHSKESNLPTRFEMARSHAYQQEAKLKAGTSDGYCATCGGKKHYFIRCRVPGAKGKFERAHFATIACACRACNGGSLPPTDIAPGRAYDLETGLIVQEREESGHICQDFPARFTPEELAEEEARLLADGAFENLEAA